MNKVTQRSPFFSQNPVTSNAHAAQSSQRRGQSARRDWRRLSPQEQSKIAANAAPQDFGGDQLMGGFVGFGQQMADPMSPDGVSMMVAGSPEALQFASPTHAVSHLNHKGGPQRVRGPLGLNKKSPFATGSQGGWNG